jgi:hypothetical protein
MGMNETNGRKTIAVALPGESFSSVWLASFINLFGELFCRFNVAPIFGYSSNVYATRGRILQSMIELDEKIMPVDYALWVDDDNTLTWPQLQLLFDGLESNPELDAVAAWCWVQPDGYAIHPLPSCGNFAFSGHKTTPLDLQYLGSVDGEPPVGPDLVPVGYTGFPAVLFRFDSLRMIADLKPFAPYPAEELEMGFLGEDTGFWLRARHAGIRLAVDRRVKVPHYKMRAAEPVAAQPPQVSVIDG